MAVRIFDRLTVVNDATKLVYANGKVEYSDNFRIQAHTRYGLFESIYTSRSMDRCKVRLSHLMRKGYIHTHSRAWKRI